MVIYKHRYFSKGDIYVSFASWLCTSIKNKSLKTPRRHLRHGLIRFRCGYNRTFKTVGKSKKE